jgi:hypothetical protein
MAIASIGTRGTAISGASTTTIARAPTATVAVGRVLVAHFATRENVAISTVTDAAGNTWQFIGRYSHSGTGDAHNEVWLCNVTTQLTTGTNITATFASAVVDKCMALWEYSVGAGTIMRTVEPVVGNEVNAANGFGSAAFAGLASQQRLFFRSGAKRANSTGTITATSGFTTHALNIRSRNSSTLAITLRAEHLIATNTGTTSNPTWAVSGNTAANFVAFEEYTPPAAQTLTPGLYTNTNTFYGHTVSAGPVTLSPGLLTNEQVFYSPTVAAGAVTQDLLPGLLTNAQTFYGPTVNRGAVTLLPGLYSNAQTFFAPAVTASKTLAPGRYDNAQVFYGPTVTSVRTLTAARYDNANTFFTHVVTQGGVTLVPPLVTNDQIFYPATVTPGAATLTAALFTNEQVFYAPTVSQATPGLLEPTLVVNTNVFYGGQVNLNITFPDWVEPGWVEDGWVGWPYFNTQTFFGATITQQDVPEVALFTTLPFVKRVRAAGTVYLPPQHTVYRLPNV